MIDPFLLFLGIIGAGAGAGAYGLAMRTTFAAGASIVAPRNLHAAGTCLCCPTDVCHARSARKPSSSGAPMPLLSLRHCPAPLTRDPSPVRVAYPLEAAATSRRRRACLLERRSARKRQGRALYCKSFAV